MRIFTERAYTVRRKAAEVKGHRFGIIKTLTNLQMHIGKTDCRPFRKSKKLEGGFSDEEVAFEDFFGGRNGGVVGYGVEAGFCVGFYRLAERRN